jgi:PIN domain nuclease of toxin-antitoxin system
MDDPADQIIVATAREENASILTKDERILTYKHVRSLW